MSDRLTLLKTAVEKYGQEAQMKMAVEEMSELTKAICKFWRTEEGTTERDQAVENIIEEAADVQIMLDQLRILFGSTKDAEMVKLSRLRKRLTRRKEQ